MRVKTEDLAKRAGEGLLTSFMRKLLRVGQIGGSSTIIPSVKKTNRLVITCAACVGGLGAEIATRTTMLPLAPTSC